MWYDSLIKGGGELTITLPGSFLPLSKQWDQQVSTVFGLLLVVSISYTPWNNMKWIIIRSLGNEGSHDKRRFGLIWKRNRSATKSSVDFTFQLWRALVHLGKIKYQLKCSRGSSLGCRVWKHPFCKHTAQHGQNTPTHRCCMKIRNRGETVAEAMTVPSRFKK